MRNRFALPRVTVFLVVSIVPAFPGMEVGLLILVPKGRHASERLDD